MPLGKLKMIWAEVRDSLWFIPGLLTLFSAALAVTMVWMETQGLVPTGDADDWLLGGGPEGARSVLSAIAGGLITVTGVVFSVTIVALQLASSQFTPRVLRNFTADRANQLVLGVFIGTFTYTLLVLRVVRSATPEQEGFIPRTSVALAVALVVVSIGFLIFFINHASRSVQVSVILEKVTSLTLWHIARRFPAMVGDSDDRVSSGVAVPTGKPAFVIAARSGYLQAVDDNALVKLAETMDLVIRMERRIGEYVLPGRSLASVWPQEALNEDICSKVRQSCVLGFERTPEQDVEFGIVEISDIAVKALSPGINDPTTAFHCIDRLSEILLALGLRQPPPNARTQEGVVRFIPMHVEYERAVGLAFDQIRHFGADNPAIAKKLLDALMQLIELVPVSRRPPLQKQIDAVGSDADEAIDRKTESPSVEHVSSEARSQAQK
jgi:uncharacterized membrane protein